MIDRYASICASCALLRIGPKGGFCEAFPDGIPEAISFDYFDHRESFPNDNDIRWRFKEGQEVALRLFEEARAEIAKPGGGPREKLGAARVNQRR